MPIRLTLVLTMLAPTPTPTQKEADAAYNAGDYRKALVLFEARAADRSVHPPDALNGVHDSLIALHETTKKPHYLCRALRVTRKLLATGPFADAGERAAWRATEARDLDQVTRAGLTCATTPQKAPAEARAIATNRSTPAATSAPSPAPTGQLDTPNEELVPVTGRAPDARAADGSQRVSEAPTPVRLATALPRGEGDALAVETPRRTPAAQAVTPRSGRGLAVAGGVALGVGLGLTATAGYLGGRMLDTWRESQELYDETGPIGTEAQAEQNAALIHDYQRQRAAMVATSVVGVSALVVGAVLVGVGAKRLARVASRTALLPVPGGLVLRARF